MAIVKIEGKTLTVPDELAAAGKDAIRAALSIDFPAVENAQIEIVEPKEKGAPSIITVTKRATPKGSPSPEFTHLADGLASLPEYVNPAVALAARAIRAELEGDTRFLDIAARSGAIERAVEEGHREGDEISKAIQSLAFLIPQTSKEVPIGF